MQPAPVVPDKKLSAMAIASLVLGALALCTCLPAPFAIGLGIAALVATNRNPSIGGKGFAVAGIVLGAVSIFTSGILLAIAIPNFIRFQARAKQAECRTQLSQLMTAELSFQSEHDRFTEDLSELDFRIEANNRYAYVLSAKPVFGSPGQIAKGDTAIRPSAAAPLDDALVANAAQRPLAGGATVGVSGQCPQCTFTAVCVAQLDSDSTLDIWSVSSAERQVEGGRTISAGELFHEVDDVTEP